MVSDFLCTFARKIIKTEKDMALPIASIPVLTGEVAWRFEEQAQKTYEKFLHRTPEEEKSVRDRYDRGMAVVKKVLENSKLGKR